MAHNEGEVRVDGGVHVGIGLYNLSQIGVS